MVTDGLKDSTTTTSMEGFMLLDRHLLTQVGNSFV